MNGYFFFAPITTLAFMTVGVFLTAIIITHDMNLSLAGTLNTVGQVFESSYEKRDTE